MAGSLVTVATACLWRVAFRRHEDPPTVRDFNSDSGYGLFMACDSGYGLFMACDSGYGLFMACGVTVATACLWRVAFRRHEDPPTVTVATACLWRVAFRRHEDSPHREGFQ
ncbi:hypothetical protein INR49_020974, partial [Caranx melampygus]